MKKREKRRDSSWRAAKQAQKVHFRKAHPNGAPDCVCEASVWFFEKIGIQRHNCGKKTKGNPKIGHGVCHAFDVRPTVEARRQWRILYSRFRSGILDPSDF